MSNSEHRYVSRRLDAYVDNELTVVDVDLITGHMIACEDCSAYVRFLLELRGVLRRLSHQSELI